MLYDSEKEYWTVYFYNEADASFGYDAGAQFYKNGEEKAFAKWLARYMNKKTPEFIHYWAEPEPERYW